MGIYKAIIKGGFNLIRVLHVVTHMNRGGLETMIMNYYRNIDRTKVQFDFLVHRDYKCDYDDEIEKLGGKIYRLPRLNPFSFDYRKRLNNFFKTHTEYAIVHVHQDCLSSIILKSAYKNKVKVRIAHSHTENQDRNLKYIIKLFYRQFIPKYATHLVACGKDAGEWMFHGADFEIINNAIDVEKYIYNTNSRKKIRKEFNISDGEFVIGHIGRFSPVKNHTFILDVFAEIVKNIDAKLLLVGGGDLKDYIKEKSIKLGISDKVIFTGVRPDVPDLLQAMDVFLFPSLYEGLGIVLIEAQTAGLHTFISNTVPKQSIISEKLMQQLSLSMPIKDWANAIINCKYKERTDCTCDVINAGYDIKSEAIKLQNFYMNCVD